MCQTQRSVDGLYQALHSERIRQGGPRLMTIACYRNAQINVMVDGILCALNLHSCERFRS